MKKKEFRKYLEEEYEMVDSRKLLNNIIDNILDYAGNLEEVEQYNFLCDMLPFVPEIDVRSVCYSNDEESTEKDYYEE